MTTSEHTHTYRSRGQLIGGVVLCVVFNLIAVVIITGKSHPGAMASSGASKAIMGSALIVFFTLLFGRLAWTAIFASAEKIRVVNMFTNFTLRWEEIEHFDIGRSGVLPMVCRIHLKGGEVRHAFGIQESNMRTGAATRLVDTLNEELAGRMGVAHPV